MIRTALRRRSRVALALLLPLLFVAPAPARATTPPPPDAGNGSVLADHGIFGSGNPRALIRKQLERLPLLPRVRERRALAVITDFADTRLEDWSGPGFNSVPDIRQQLAQMEAHWEWLSHGTEDMQWDIVRITLPQPLSPTAYAGWPDFREAVGRLLRQEVSISDYDANGDGVIDSAWVVVANQDREYDYLIGGASSNGGVNQFVDGQSSLSVQVGATGNFNHELGHTLGLPDLYGPNDTVHFLTLMSDSWPVPPQDFTAYERSLLGWLKPRTLSPGRHRVSLRNASERFEAVRIPTGRPNEFFLIEYRNRPETGFGSSAPDYNGLAVYHVLENSSQWIDPPLLKLEAADGWIAPGQAPEFNDFLYPGNPDMREPLVLRSHFAGVPVATLDNVEWHGDEIRFEVKVLPPLAGVLGNLVLRNRLQNPSFEEGGELPTTWSPESFLPTALFGRDAGVANRGRSSASITSPTPNDARWIQTVSGLTPGQAYEFCGRLRGRDIEVTPEAQVGGNVSVMGGFVRSRSLAGRFDWTPACVVHQPETDTDTFACRLGFYGSLVSGRLWCDRMTLFPLRSAFGSPNPQ
ncbi:MAG: hypothetical protein K0Q68_1566 [Moraxellaceae bacterium]|nr:hypothetical protein [Moraxellaceae bacterium]